MMNKGILCIMGLLSSLSVEAITLEECRQMAHDNYPAVKQYGMIEQSRDFTLENAAKGWLPQVAASVGTYAFTDILKMNAQMDMMGIDMKNYMTNASVTIRQNVYDGGQIAAQKQVVNAQTEVQRRQLDVSMYAVYEQIDQLYFGILLLDEQLTQNELILHDLGMSEKTVRSMMKGGIANPSDLDAILVEKIKVCQQKESLTASRRAYFRMLRIFVGKELSENERLYKPEGKSVPSLDAFSSSGVVGVCVQNGEWNVNRPELSYYASQNLLLDAQRKQLDSKLRPMVSLFGMGMVHSKVSDLLSKGLLVGGISISWNIGALYTRKNDIRKLEVQKAMNDQQRETFLFNNRLQNEETSGTIESLEKLIAQDEEIVRLRESIRSKGDKKVVLGTESVNELVRDINAVSLARSQKAQHEIQLLKEIYQQRNINNN